MHNNKEILKTNLSMVSLLIVVEAILQSTRSNPNITWHFTKEIKHECLLGNRGVPAEFKTLRAAIVFFLFKVFRKNINRKMLVEFFETEENYSKDFYEKSALFKKIDAHLGEDKNLLEFAMSYVDEWNKAEKAVFKNESLFSSLNIEPDEFAKILFAHIAEKATEYFAFLTTVDDIKKKNRKAKYVMCRNLFVLVFHSKFPTTSYSIIGKFLNDEDHYRVQFSFGRHEELFESNNQEYINFFLQTRESFISKITQTQPA